MLTLRQARESKGVTQAEMARALGISRGHYHWNEKHPDGMTAEMFKAACGYLGYSVDEVSVRMPSD